MVGGVMSGDYEALRSMEARMKALEESNRNVLSQLSSVSEQMRDNTNALQEYIDLGKKLKIGLGFLGMLESVAVWLTKIGAAVALSWATWKFLVKEAIASVLKSQ